MKSILDPSFRYTPSFSTDLKKAFSKVRRERRKHVERTASGSADILPIFKGIEASRG